MINKMPIPKEGLRGIPQVERFLDGIFRTAIHYEDPTKWEIVYRNYVVCFRGKNDYKAAFEEIYRRSTGHVFQENIEELVKYCGGEIVTIKDFYQSKVTDNKIEITTNYLVIKNEEQFYKATDWLKEKLLAFEISGEFHKWQG